MTITGTNHFVSRASAISYYRYQNPDLTIDELQRMVDDKAHENEIQFGQPSHKKGEKIIKIDNGCRYGIESN